MPQTIHNPLKPKAITIREEKGISKEVTLSVGNNFGNSLPFLQR